MAIQKLLPNFIPESSYYYPDGGGNPYNGDRNQFYLGQFTLLTSSTYSGGVAQDNLSTPDSSSKSVNYIRKSISSPDDGTYVGLRDFTSGDYVSDYNRMIIVYDVPSVKVRGLTARLRYSGHPLVTPSGYLGYYVYDDNTDITGPGTGNNYRLIGNHVNVFPSSTGWSESSFATIEFPQFDSSNSGWIIDNDLLDNLIGSGSYIYLDMIFSPTGDQYASIQMNQNIGFSAFEIEVSGDISSKYLNMHTYSAPIQQSGAIDLYTKRHGYIDSIERSTYSGVQKALPRPGTYAGGSGQLVYFNPTDYLTYRIATCYSGATSELVGSPGEISNYIRESTDNPENISYIGLSEYITSLTGHSNTLNLAMGMRLDNLSGEPVSLKTNMTYSGVPNLLSPNIANVKSQYFLTLDNDVYEIGYASEPVPQLMNYMAYSFTKFSFPELFLDGREQPNANNRVFVSGALLRNLISSGAEFSTYTTAQITSNYVFGYKNHGISAFDVEASGLVVNTETPHPQLYISGSYPEKSVDMFMSSKSGIDNNLTLYTSGNNQIFSGLTFVTPFPSFDTKSLNFHTIGEYLTSLNMYIENGTFKSGNKEVNLVTYNNYSSGEIVNNFNIHTKSYSGDYDDIYMYIGGTGSRSASGNFYLYTGSHNEPFLENINLFTYNDLRSGNAPIDFHLYSTTSDSGILNLYIGGDRYGLTSGIFDIYMSQIPENSVSAIPLLISNNKGYISGDFGNNQTVNFTTVSKISNSSDINIYMLGGKYGTDSGNISIFLLGDNVSGYIPLYVHNVLDYMNGEVSLNLKSYLDYSGDFPLHINGGGIDLRQGELTLVTRSAIANSGDVEMSIVGNIAKGPINLYIKAKELSYDNNNFPLYTFSAFNSGIYNSFELSVRTEDFDSYLPMYMPVSSYGETTSDITMVMLNDTTSDKDVFLYIENNVESKNANYTLFTRGNGLLDGGSVYSSSMNLFIDRGNESVYNIIPMALMGPSGINDYVPLVMSGGYISESGIYLSLPSSKDSVNKTVGTYIHGFLY